MVVVTRTSEYLEHHGIQGQKWGVRNGPPYPLDYEQHNVSEKSKNPKGSLNNYENNNPKSKLGKLEDRPTRYKVKRKTGNATVASGLESTKLKSSGDNKERKKLTPEQKEKLIKALKIGAVAAGVALAAYGGYKVFNAYNAKQLIDPKTGLPLLSKKLTPAENVKGINPGAIKTPFGPIDAVEGSTMNCMLCTTTYEARARGFDVHAGLSTEGFMPSFFNNAFKTSDGSPVTKLLKKPRIATSDALEDYMLSMYPDGARGNLCVYWKGLFGGGHSMIWEKIDGKIIVRDGQTGTVMQSLEKAIKNANISESLLLRTDNLEMNFEWLTQNNYLRTENSTKFIVDNLKNIPGNLMQDDVARTIASLASIPVELWGGVQISKAVKKSTKGNNIKKDDKR